MKDILVVFGTRPEAIKMAPLVNELKKHKGYFNVKVCVTGQHREMLDQVLDFFEIKPDYDLNIMSPNQTLTEVTGRILEGLGEIFSSVYKPDIVLVHGDTTTAMASSLSAFYYQIKVAHIEAGLRTSNIYSPFPEEANRQLISILANYHFCPTSKSYDNLLKENKNQENITVVGNTVIDALLTSINKILHNKHIEKKIIENISNEYLIKERDFILITGHRRENFGDGFINICQALKEIAMQNPSIDIVYPVHLNPNVQKPVKEILKDISNIYLIKPLAYENFIYLMYKSLFIITDSGGIQEEAPSLNKSVLLMRNNTERSEAVEAGGVKLVGTNKYEIVKSANELINNTNKIFTKMSNIINPYGDGKACEKIINFLIKESK